MRLRHASSAGNPIEFRFSILARKLLHRGSFKSAGELKKRIEASAPPLAHGRLHRAASIRALLQGFKVT